MQTPHHPLQKAFEAQGIELENLTDARFVRMINNGQTRLISGVWNEAPFGECTEEMLEVAKRRLRDRFAVVGLTERFDETLLHLKIVLGWNISWYTQENVTRRQPHPRDGPQKVIGDILCVNQLDVALYDYATDLFEKQRQVLGEKFPTQYTRVLKNLGMKSLYQRRRRFSVGC